MTTARSRMRILYQIAKADFLERVRRYSFLLTLALAFYFGYLAAVGRISMQAGAGRGVYNSAWIGSLMMLVTTSFLTLAGFYIIKNTVERDVQTRVGQILAATPLSKPSYVLGKTVSNFAVLAAMVSLLALSGIAVQIWRGEDPHVHLGTLLSPFLVIALPTMGLLAALAVLFETIPSLRGGLGNVAYFFLWTAGLSVPLAEHSVFWDWTGIEIVWSNIFAARHMASGPAGFSLSIGARSQGPATFRWEGIDWTPSILLSRLVLLGAAAALVLLAALLFDRFETVGLGVEGKRRAPESQAPALPKAPAAPAQTFSLETLTPARGHFRFGTMFVSEMRLMLEGQRWWWYAVAAGLLIAQFATPLAISRQILVFAWIWPILLWSAMGTREARFEAGPFIFSSARSITRQFPAAWCAGFALAALTGGGTALRLLVAGDGRTFLAWLVGALFIPTLALALGVWSKTGKTFEIVYVLLWYIGPWNHVPPFDFMGATPLAVRAGMAIYFLVLTAVLAAVATAGRKRQLQS